MKTSTKIAIAGIVVITTAYFLKKQFTPNPLTKDEFGTALDNAGYTTYIRGNKEYAKIPGGVMEISDNVPLNFAQRVLLGADRFVPGTFLSRWALT